jgi:hypothetical protein
MDSDIFEGLPTTDELAGDAAPDSANPEGLTSAPPAPPVDAPSIEPAPQTVAAPVSREPTVAAIATPQEQGEVSSSNRSDPAAPIEKAAAGELSGKEEAVKSATGLSSLAHIPDGPRVDVSAATVARMMGIASTSDLRLLEGRVDLLTSRVAAILTKMDRCLSMFGSVPTASDIGRLEVQVAAMKSMMRELLDAVGAPVSSGKEQADRAAAQEQSRKLREGIKTNTES